MSSKQEKLTRVKTLGEKKPHRDLVAWKKSLDLVEYIYRLTKTFPQQECYGLASQMQRAAVSVPSNIAEGAAGRTRAQFQNFLSNAIGSLNEIDTQVEIAQRLGYSTEEDLARIRELLDACLALTYGLRRSILRKSEGTS